MVRVLILCAGPQEKYHTGNPKYGDPYRIVEKHPIKHLLPVFGEPVLHRTIRQLRLMGHRATIVAGAEFPVPDDANHLVPAERESTAQTLLSTQDAWGNDGEQVLILYGDVVYHTATLRMMLDDTSRLRFFGWHADQAGFTFNDHALVATHTKKAYDSSRGTNYANKGLWLTYRSIAGLPLNKHTFDDKGMYQHIGEEFTRDFDYPHEYVAWMNKHGPDEDPECPLVGAQHDTAVIIRFCYPPEAVAEPKRGFAWRLEWLRSEVLPRLLRQTTREFDIWVWVHPDHVDLFAEFGSRVRTFHVDTGLPAWRADIPWANVVDLPRYGVQVRIDSDDIPGPRYVETALAELKGMPPRALVHFQPYKVQVATGDVWNMKPYHSERCSAFLALKQPVENEAYDWVYGRSHTKMASIVDEVRLIDEGHAWIACHDHNDSTKITSCGGTRLGNGPGAKWSTPTVTTRHRASTKGETCFVYPLRKGASEYNDLEILLSLRSIHKHWQGGAPRIVIVGDCPDWLTDVTHIPARQVCVDSQSDALMNVLMACRSKLVLNDFVLMNDDFFFLSDLDHISNLTLGTLDSVLARFKHTTSYVRAVERSRAWLAARSLPDTSFEVHYPLNVRGKDFRVVFDDHKVEAEPVVYRSIYGNAQHLQAQEVERDFKIYRANEDVRALDASFISTDNIVLRPGRFRDALIRRFPEPSPWEAMD